MICRKKTHPNNVNILDEYKNKLKTAAVTLHNIKESQPPPENREDDTTTISSNPTPHVYLGDSWFTSIDVVANVSGYYIGNLKTNSKGYPKTYLTETMKDWPSGSYLNLRAKVQGRTIFAMGYKYC